MPITAEDRVIVCPDPAFLAPAHRPRQSNLKRIQRIHRIRLEKKPAVESPMNVVCALIELRSERAELSFRQMVKHVEAADEVSVCEGIAAVGDGNVPNRELWTIAQAASETLEELDVRLDDRDLQPASQQRLRVAAASSADFNHAAAHRHSKAREQAIENQPMMIVENVPVQIIMGKRLVVCTHVSR